MINNLLKNKKGSVIDLAFIIIILFFFSFVILMGYKITHEINEKYSISAETDTYSLEAVDELEGYYPGVYDNMFLLIAIGVSIASIAMAALVRVHPIFIIFYIIFWIILVVISAGFTNIYDEMASNDQLIDLSSNMVKMNVVMEYLPWLIAIVGTILAIVMYKAWRDDQ